MRRRLAGVAVALFLGCAGAPEPVRRAEGLLAKAEAPSGLVRLRCEPADAEVAVDGVSRGVCSDFQGERGLRLGDGPHRLEIQKAGHWPYQAVIEPDGVRSTLGVVLVPRTPARPDGADRQP